MNSATVTEFEEELLAMERAEGVRPSPKGATVFYGESSIRFRDTLAVDFAPMNASLGIHVIDLHPAMLGPDGEPRHALFDPDGLHLNAAGYALWTALVRAALAD